MYLSEINTQKLNKIFILQKEEKSILMGFFFGFIFKFTRNLFLIKSKLKK